MTYGEIRTKFLARLNRRDCTPTLADGFLQDAITRIQRVIRIPAMEKSVLVTLDGPNYFDDGALAIPSDYIHLKDIFASTSSGLITRLVRKDLGYVLKLASEWVGLTPTCFARQGPTWVFGPTPLAETVIRVDYFAEFEDVEEVADDTILTAIAHDLILYGALSYAADHWVDKRGPLFEQRFTQIISDIQNQGDADELTGSAQVSPAFTYPEEDGI